MFLHGPSPRNSNSPRSSSAADERARAGIPNGQTTGTPSSGRGRLEKMIAQSANRSESPVDVQAPVAVAVAVPVAVQVPVHASSPAVSAAPAATSAAQGQSSLRSTRSGGSISVGAGVGVGASAERAHASDTPIIRPPHMRRSQTNDAVDMLVLIASSPHSASSSATGGDGGDKDREGFFRPEHKASPVVASSSSSAKSNHLAVRGIGLGPRGGKIGNSASGSETAASTGAEPAAPETEATGGASLDRAEAPRRSNRRTPAPASSHTAAATAAAAAAAETTPSNLQQLRQAQAQTRAVEAVTSSSAGASQGKGKGNGNGNALGAGTDASSAMPSSVGVKRGRMPLSINTELANTSSRSCTAAAAAAGAAAAGAAAAGAAAAGAAAMVVTSQIKAEIAGPSAVFGAEAEAASGNQAPETKRLRSSRR
jgi:hypothetical protein